MIGLNAGLIGAARTSRRGAAVGLWTPNEQVIYQRQNAWIGDANFANVSLLLHMDGSNNSTAFTDSSLNALTVTANGDAKISTAQSKFGGASAAFDGNGDYLSCAASALFNFGTGDFTIECWFYIASNSSANLNGNRDACLFSIVSGSSIAATLLVSGNASTTGTGLVLYKSINTETTVIANSTITQSAWHHAAVSRSGSSIRVFLDGTQIGSTATSSTIWGESYPAFVGTNVIGGYLDYFNGYIDDLRITKGVARYTANFTSPSAPFPDA